MFHLLSDRYQTIINF